MLAVRLLCVAPALFLAPLGVAAQTPPTEASPAEAALPSADSLFWAMDPAGALSLLESHLASAPDDLEARWRAARAALVVAVMTPDRRARVAWLREAETHGERALETHPDHLEALTWTAAAKGRLAISTGSPAARAGHAKAVWDLTARLLAVEPEHALGNDIRGKLNQEVRKMRGVTRFLARTFAGNNEALRESSWERAEEHLQKAIANDPTVVLFYLDLGETYQLQGKDELARATYETGLALPDLYPPDPVFKASMRKRLEQLAGR